MKYLITIIIVLSGIQLVAKTALDIENTRKSESEYYQEVLNDTLIINNTTNEIVSVTGMGLSCGCTVISESQFDINANSTKRVPFTVDLTHTKNGKTIKISIMTSNNDTTQLSYNYKVKEILTVDPRIISIETPNDNIKYDLELKNVSNSKIKIADIKVDMISGSTPEISITKNDILSGEDLSLNLEMNEINPQNIGKIELHYIVDDSIVLYKSIDYIINKGIKR